MSDITVSDISRLIVTQLGIENELKAERSKAPIKTSGIFKREGNPTCEFNCSSISICILRGG